MQVRIVITTLLLAIIFNAPSPRPARAAAMPSDDWPQLQHDAQRTGSSSAAVSGPHRFYWRWNSVPLASRAQPVVAGGRLFIGGLDNTLYALDAAGDKGGADPDILWANNLGSPIRAGAAVDGDIVIVGTHGGVVYGCDVATGAVRWRFVVGSPVLAAPLIVDGTAYLGAADGVFFALDTASGVLRWNTRLDEPVLSSAALSADGAAIFVANERPAAYALNAASGAVQWRTLLQGQGAADRWPVVVGNTVVFRTQPLRNFHDLLRVDDVLDAAGPLKDDWDDDWAGVQPNIVAHLNAHPERQTFFALDAASGASHGVAPVLYAFGVNDAPAPPVVRDGKLYLFYRARHGIQNDAHSIHVTTKYDSELGVMDPMTLAISGVRASQPFSSQWRGTSDEASTLSLAGPLLLVDNWERFGGVNTDTGALTGIAQVSHDWNECNVSCEANDLLMPFFEGAPTGLRNAEGASHTAAVVASGRIFWRVLQGGLASIGPAGTEMSAATRVQTKATRLAPMGRSPQGVASPLAPQADYSAYVIDAPVRPISAAPADLVQRLEDAVRQVVDTGGHLKPLFIERGLSTPQSWPPDSDKPPAQTGIFHIADTISGNVYWYDPGELVYSLALTYPYLSPPLRERLKVYLKQEIARYSPLEPLPFGGLPWLREGVDRSLYDVPFSSELNNWPPPAPPIQTLYGLWAYAEYTDDWQYLVDNWAGVKALFDARKDSIDSYARIAGAIGYYRIAQHLDKPDEAAEALNAANVAFAAGLDFAAFRERANQLYPDSVINEPQPLGVRAPVFFGLVPEVGRFLHDNLASEVDAELAQRTGADGARLWYATRAGNQGIEMSAENSFHGPDLAWGMFLAKAYVQGTDRPALRALLDRPWGLGDLWYLQKLVATIEAGDSSPPPTLSLSDLAPEHTSLNGVVLRWTTNVAASGWVEYGTLASYGQSTPLWLSPVEVHRVGLTNLEPNIIYHYRVCSTAPGGTACSEDAIFYTTDESYVFLSLMRR